MEMEKIKLEPKEFWDDREWAYKHYSELVREYPDEWVAVANKEVVSANKDLGKVEMKVKELGKKNVPIIFVECGSHV